MNDTIPKDYNFQKWKWFYLQFGEIYNYIYIFIVFNIKLQEKIKKLNSIFFKYRLRFSFNERRLQTSSYNFVALSSIVILK